MVIFRPLIKDKIDLTQFSITILNFKLYKI